MPPEQSQTAPETAPETTSEPVSDVAASPVESSDSSLVKKLGLGLIVILILVLGYIVFFTSLLTSAPASVNGVAISQVEYQNSINTLTTQFAAQGVDVENEQAQQQISDDALNRLINTQLLLQAAAADGYTADDAAVDAQVAVLVEQFGGQEPLNDHLASLQLTESMMREDISQQIIVEEYLLNETAVGDVTVSDEEVVNLYSDLRGQFGDQLPPLEEIRGQVEADALSQKQQEMLGSVLAGLRAEADVVIN